MSGNNCSSHSSKTLHEEEEEVNYLVVKATTLYIIYTHMWGEALCKKFTSLSSASSDCLYIIIIIKRLILSIFFLEDIFLFLLILLINVIL